MERLRANFLYYLTAAMLALGVIALCVSFFTSLSPAADQRPGEIIEFDLSTLAEGEHVRLMIFGELVYIRHRTPADIKATRSVFHSAQYPERDDDRLLAYEGQKDSRYIIVEGYAGRWCTVMANSGDFGDQGGWYCTRGSHFDGSDRLRKGPDFNLRVPPNARLSSMTTVQFFERLPLQLPD